VSRSYIPTDRGICVVGDLVSYDAALDCANLIEWLHECKGCVGDSLVKSLAQSVHISKDAQAGSASAPATEALFKRVTQNVGSTDGDRARNYLAVRCPAIYTKAKRLRPLVQQKCFRPLSAAGGGSWT
jgi:hypothetical protein